MKTKTKLIITFLCILLSACSANAGLSETDMLYTVYTAAASTIEAQMTASTPAMTPTLFVPPTLFSLPTSALVTPTVEQVISNPSSSVSTANGCNNAIFISDVTVADGTVFAPGESFVKTWRVQNTGTCAWSESYSLSFISGTDMSGETTDIAQQVSVSSTGDLSVSLIAPLTVGTYTGYWRLTDESGNLFGQSVYVMIVVSNDSSTTTVTSTPTIEASSSDGTDTPTSIATPTPTETGSS